MDTTRNVHPLTRLLVVAIFLAGPALLHAQSIRRDIFLEAGWNSIWLDVNPEPSAPAEFLGAVDYESIWTYQAEFAVASGDRWLCHHRDTTIVDDTLFSVEGGRGYLIKMRNAENLTVVGPPVRGGLRLLGDSHALVGTTPDGRLPFETFLSISGIEASVVSIHSLDAGLEEPRFRPVAPIRPILESTAYWIFSGQDAVGVEPIQTKSSVGGLGFRDGMDAVEFTVTIPEATATRRVSVRAAESANGSGAKWLEFLSTDGTWSPLSNGDFEDLPAGETTASWTLRATRDNADGRTVAAIGAEGGVCSPDAPEAIIEVTDGGGNLVAVGASIEERRLDGLWIGMAQLDEVATHPDVVSTSEFAAAPTMNMALILRVPGESDRRNGASIEILDRAIVSVFREGLEKKIRFESVLFHEPVALGGSLDECGRDGVLTGSTLISDSDNLNPYRHQYHQEHGVVYSIQRTITLRFSDTDELSESLGLASAGGLFGGYEEEITDGDGNPIIPGATVRVRGQFRLRRVADLNSIE